MKKRLFFLLTFCFIVTYSFAQSSQEEINQMKDQLLKAKNDSTRLQFSFDLAFGYRFSQIDSSLHYSDITIELADKLNLPSIKAQMLSLKGATVLEAGKLPESLRFQFESLEISEKMKDTSNIAFAFNRIGNIYMELGDYRKANEYYFRSKDLFEKIRDTLMVYNEVSNIGNIYDLMQIADSGLYYQQIVFDAANTSTDRRKFTRPEMMFRMGNAYKLKGDKVKAMYFYKLGIKEANTDNDTRNLTMNNLFLAKLYDEMNMPDSSIKYAFNAIQTGKTISFRKGVYDASILLSGLYKKRNRDDSAYKYLSIANVEKDSLTGTTRFQELQRIILDEQERERNTEAKRIANQNKQRQTVLLTGLAIFLIIASILYLNNKQKQKTNKILEATLTNLKSTQSQLIQSEKMASLGELTAGIAHEIQNPLNFVNNFSEVNTELIDEMTEGLSAGKTADVINLASDIKANNEKIAFHGKRAESIVKGMLQHSRSGSSQKEPTDINNLLDECMRLSFHGMRAKDKSFNAKMDTTFDSSLGPINIVSQEISRVFLNLFTNAFYAVLQKKKEMAADELYDPEVSTAIKKEGNKVKIIIADNGNGIPQKVIDKIFQPFFTTKPTGEGTGLGLSLSYDIITKGHNGELKVETKEGEFARFTITLPI